MKPAEPAQHVDRRHEPVVCERLLGRPHDASLEPLLAAFRHRRSAYRPPPRATQPPAQRSPRELHLLTPPDLPRQRHRGGAPLRARPPEILLRQAHANAIVDRLPGSLNPYDSVSPMRSWLEWSGRRKHSPARCSGSAHIGRGLRERTGRLCEHSTPPGSRVTTDGRDGARNGSRT